MIKNLQEQMKEAAKKLDFEEAANLRDAIMELQSSSRKPKTRKGRILMAMIKLLFAVHVNII